VGPRHNRHTLRRRLTALFVIVGIPAQLFWVGLGEATAQGDGATPTHGAPIVIIASVGSALLLCAVLLYVPEGIQRVKRAYRERQEFKNRFK
jgi:hypothetical protein